MRVAVLFNTAAEGGFLKEDIAYADDAITNARRIVQSFNEGGYQAGLVEITDSGVVGQLSRLRGKVDVIFNLTESVGLKLVLKVIKNLEKLNLPYAGANEFGHLTTSDKLKIKRMLIAHNISTPPAQFFRTGKEKLSLAQSFPLVVKATTEHGSMSVHQDAVVETDSQLRKQISYLLEKYPGIPAMAEEYVAGREINSTVIGNLDWAICLPLSEVVFERSYQNGRKWPIYTYEAKYNHGTADFDDAPARLVDWLEEAEAKEIEDLSIKICQITQCYDYARTDIRYDISRRIPYFVDINSYPCLLDDPVSDTICVSRLAVGWDYLRILEEIAQSGIKRWEQKQETLPQRYLEARI